MCLPWLDLDRTWTHVMTTKSIRRFLALGLLALPLAGCTATSVANDLNVYDTGSMDADRFAEQTYPIWARPVVVKKKVVIKETVHVAPQTETVYETDEGFTTQSIPMQRIAGYGKLDDAGHWLPAIPVEDVPPQFLRREVKYQTSERPGTIVVDTAARHLYLVLGNGRAMRYGVGIGRQGYAWKGKGVIQYKRTWPRWTPSENYVADKPEMKMFSASYGGLVGGVKNPLGARALYIYAGGEDTLFRVHGTPDWKSIGRQASSGCIRMFNQDVIDLYARVYDGATIIVK
jgi:lipoprotein-anchoring transpeptidase ErfK/SrfK